MKAALGLLLSPLLVLPTSAQNVVHVKNLKIVCVIYRGDADSRHYLDGHAVQQAKNGVELGRLFYFRNSHAQLNCELHWLIRDQAPPDTSGPTMDHIEADLRAHNIRPGQYDSVFVTGVGLSGNFGGFRFSDGAAGCFGLHGVRGSMTWYPEDEADVAYGTAWVFVHEFQHALDLVTAEDSDRPDLLHAHPYVDRQEKFFKGLYQGGEHFDWIALTLREFDGYADLKGITNGVLECADADGDGLPDQDKRLPMDEKRFGSDPTKQDTDGDGLDDLAEFVAGRYRSSDPMNTDTDNDSLLDGRDRYPLLPIAETLAYSPGGGSSATVQPLLRGAFARNDAGGEVEVRGAWNEDGLYFYFLGPRKFVVHAKIDGSAGTGFWEGGDTYVLRIADETVQFAGLGLTGDAHGSMALATPQRADRSEQWGLFAHIYAGLGQGISKEINYGGKRDADDIVDGLTLVAGRSVAFNFIFEFEDGTRACLTPHHTMYAVKLDKPADAAAHPVLRCPEATSTDVPVAEVLGVHARAQVQIVRSNEVVSAPDAVEQIVGARIGPGPVRLTKIRADGTYKLTARTGDQRSWPVLLTVDRTAAAPRLTRAGATLKAQCEPRAACELWWGIDGTPVAPLAGATADESGTVEFALSDDLLAGWLVTGFEGSRFEKPVFVESWDKIDRNFQGGPADPRLPADEFSYRFEGLLMIDKAGPWTFELGSDDGSRLWLDDEPVINHWGHHGFTTRTASVELAPGPHRARVDYYELDGWAGITLRAAPHGEGLSAALPIRGAPLPLDDIQLFGLQTDRLGNRSDFSAPVDGKG
ncbi:MAG: hypothetical protein KKB50_12435 [Planctomycetes bacterium]|nr:hypothetical protein [Planctomycetota bacterium]